MVSKGSQIRQSWERGGRLPPTQGEVVTSSLLALRLDSTEVIVLGFRLADTRSVPTWPVGGFCGWYIADVGPTLSVGSLSNGTLAEGASWLYSVCLRTVAGLTKRIEAGHRKGPASLCLSLARTPQAGRKARPLVGGDRRHGQG